MVALSEGESHVLPQRKIVARALVSSIAERPFLFPSEVVDDFGTIAQMEEGHSDGMGMLIIGTHFGVRDYPDLFKTLVFQTELRDKKAMSAISLHHASKKLLSVSDNLFGVTVIPVANEDSLERPEYANMSRRERVQTFTEFFDAAAEALRNGETVALAINAGRRPFLMMDDPQRTIGTFMEQMAKRGVANYGIAPVVLSVPGKETYSKWAAGGMNPGKVYRYTMGEYTTAEEVSEHSSIDGSVSNNADLFFRHQFESLITPEYKMPDTFESIAVVGAVGQTGELFIREIDRRLKNVKVTGIVRPDQITTLVPVSEKVTYTGDLESALAGHPEAVILATPNPTEEVLRRIAEHAKRPLTIILPQNGVEVSALAKMYLPGITLVRASLFTIASRNAAGEVDYRSDKLRIGLAPIPNEHGTVYSRAEQEGLAKAKALFERSLFDVKMFADYQSMELTKLAVNGIGATGAITGLTPEQTFNDPQLFALEAEMFKNHIRIMRAAGIDFADIPWQNISLLQKLQYAPTVILNARGIRRLIASQIVKGRENRPPAAAEKIATGRPTEILYYHQPFVDLAEQYGFKAPADRAILEMLQLHQAGPRAGINLNEMSLDEKKKMLLAWYAHFENETV